jgi:hypothetical protein
MEKNFDDMSSEERITYLVDGLSNYLLTISIEARTALRASGFTPEKAKEFKLLELIEGRSMGQHDKIGAMDLLDHLRANLADVGMYEDEDEDEEEDEESESDELESVEA